VQNHDRQWEKNGERRFQMQVGGLGTFEFAHNPSDGRWSVIRTMNNIGPKHNLRLA